MESSGNNALISRRSMDLINAVFNSIQHTDGKTWVMIISAFIALWGHTSSLRPYMHVYLSLSSESKSNMMFNIANKGKVGAKKVKIILENGNTIIPRFDEGTSKDGKPFVSDRGEDMNLRIPIFHKKEVIPPDFHYETFLGRAAGEEGNNKFTEPFVVIVKYKSSLPIVNWIPYVGCFKEKFYINPRMFNDAMG